MLQGMIASGDSFAWSVDLETCPMHDVRLLQMMARDVIILAFAGFLGTACHVAQMGCMHQCARGTIRSRDMAHLIFLRLSMALCCVDMIRAILFNEI